METIKFESTVLFDEGGIETVIYRSQSIGGEYSSQRLCFEAVLSQFYNEDSLVYLTDKDVEQLLLDHQIYIKFVDS